MLITGVKNTRSYVGGINQIEDQFTLKLVVSQFDISEKKVGEPLLTIPRIVAYNDAGVHVSPCGTKIGVCIWEENAGYKIAILSLMGQVGMTLYQAPLEREYGSALTTLRFSPTSSHLLVAFSFRPHNPVLRAARKNYSLPPEANREEQMPPQVSVIHIYRSGHPFEVVRLLNANLPDPVFVTMNSLSLLLNTHRPGLTEILEPCGNVSSMPRGKILAMRHIMLNDTTADRNLRIKVRSGTRMECKGTVYGRNHRTRTEGKHHSPSGLNIEMVNAMGELDVSKLQYHFRNVITNENARMARINQITTQFTTMDTYENYTALGFSFLSLAWTIEAASLIPMERKSYHVPENLLGGTGLRSDKRDLDYEVAVHETAKGQFGFSSNIGGSALGDFSDWGERRGPDDNMLRQADFWMVDAYDDGHTKIDECRFKTAGFVNRRFLANNYFRDVILDSDVVHGHTRAYPDDDADIASVLYRKKYFVRREGMTLKDIAALLLALYHRKRHTPFLCDQEVNLAKPTDNIVFIGCTTDEIQADIALINERGICEQLTFDDVIMAMHRFCALHRCYDDFSNAMVLFDNFVAQPDPDTVEAHTYFAVQWQTDLPELGMRRAALAILLAGQAASITPMSMDHLRQWKGNHRAHIIISMAVNTLWFWGEYLYVARHLEWDDAAADLQNGKDHEMNIQLWQSTLLSGMLGQKQPVSFFDNTGTRFRHALEKNFGVKTIPISNRPDSREMSMVFSIVTLGDATTLHPKYTVPPACTAMMLGVGGSLVSGTPYAPQFDVLHPEKQRVNRQIAAQTSRENIWAIGVSGRFLGYDVRYSDGSLHLPGQHLVMFAPNSDEIAPPPVFDSTFGFSRPHILFGVSYREHVFGESPLEYLPTNEIRTFTWRLGKSVLKAAPNRRAMDSQMIGGRGHLGSTLFTRVVIEREYIGMVMSEHILSEGDFRVETQRERGELSRPEEIARHLVDGINTAVFAPVDGGYGVLYGTMFGRVRMFS